MTFFGQIFSYLSRLLPIAPHTKPTKDRRPEVISPSMTAVPKVSLFAIIRTISIVSLITSLALCGGTSCRSLSSRIIFDTDKSSERIRNGMSVHTEAADLAEPLVKNGEIYGMSIGVITPDGLSHTSGFGHTGIEGETSTPDSDTIYEIGSLSKLFASVLLAELVADGTLEYDDTLKDILPADTKLSEDAARITLYELDTHTSGLPREFFTFQQMRYVTSFLLTGRNLYGYIDRDWMYDYLADCELTPKEERQYVYSNLGIGLLAHLIEVKTGRRYAELLQKKIFTPLHMKDTGFTLTDEQKKRLAVGHAGDQPKFLARGTIVDTWDMGDVMNPTGGMYSTTDDLLLFAKAHLGMINSPVSRSLSQTRMPLVRTPEEDVNEESACGWVIDYFDNKTYTITYKHGMVAGYSAYIGLNINQNIAVIVLYNTFNWNEKVGHNLILRLSKGIHEQTTAGK